MADGWLDADWEANPSGNITITVQKHGSNSNSIITVTVIPTTMKVN